VESARALIPPSRQRRETLCAFGKNVHCFTKKIGSSATRSVNVAVPREEEVHVVPDSIAASLVLPPHSKDGQGTRLTFYVSPR
jgi:hypothetical protein